MGAVAKKTAQTLRGSTSLDV